MQRFIPNYAEIVNEITNMLKKDNEFKWIVHDIYSFSQIKKAISEAPVLASPDYLKLFSIFSFASETTLAIVLLQKNDDGYEQPIDFSSKVMRYVELRYDIMEKKEYSLVQAMKVL